MSSPSAQVGQGDALMLPSTAANDDTASSSSPPHKNSKYRLVALDLDGTLLAPNHKITDASAEYLRRLHAQGFHVAIATGRAPPSTSEVIRRLDLPSLAQPHSCSGFPLVCLNGACGLKVNIDAETAELHYTELFHDPVPRGVTEKVLALAMKMGLVTNYYNGMAIFAQPTHESHHHLTRRYTELTGTPITHVDDDYQGLLSTGLPSKLLVFCTEAAIDELYQQLSEELADEAHVIRGSPPFFVEVLNKEVCKGHGLHRICESLNIPLEETIAFGDGDNDIEFLQLAGRGIAMKNARDNVKKVANEVTKWTNAENGVVRTLEAMERQGLLRLADKMYEPSWYF